METQTILFVDDEAMIRKANVQTLNLAGYTVEEYDSAQAALPNITADWPGIIISDIRMPGMDGLEFLSKIQSIDKDIPVILITGHGDVSMAVQAMRDGAYDFIEKPFAADTLLEAVRRAQEKRQLALENRQLRRALQQQHNMGETIIGQSPAIQQLRQMIAQMADMDADVLILGETGTGKEVVARALHEQSGRCKHAFVAVNCGAVADNLIESELFGHEAGAFTGADKQRIGRLEYSDKGTFFLDEIESMPLPAQVHLLRALQERSIERVGSNKAISLDLRVIAATKVDLADASSAGDFREDLYYRLNVVTLQIPPLRERIEDIPLLFEYFISLANAKYGRDISSPGAEQMPALMSHSWPGNVRELKNIADRYVLLGESLDYDIEKLIHGNACDVALTLPLQVDCFEKTLIAQQLKVHKGNLKQTMESLGVPRKTLYDKMKKYGLDKKTYK